MYRLREGDWLDVCVYMSQVCSRKRISGMCTTTHSRLTLLHTEDFNQSSKITVEVQSKNQLDKVVLQEFADVEWRDTFRMTWNDSYAH